MIPPVGVRFDTRHCVLSGSTCVGGASGGRSSLLLSSSSHSGWSSAICIAVSGLLHIGVAILVVYMLC